MGCYIGLNFLGALAYADDIVLLAPGPSAIRMLLKMCDEYAQQYLLFLMVRNPNVFSFRAWVMLA